MNNSHNGSNQIFICYRRENTSNSVAGRIYDRLVQKFGEDAVFRDINSIPLGINFKQYIDSVIKRCKLFLVVIGDDWLEEDVELGKRRIDNPSDFVRIEIELALQRNIPVIPLFVQRVPVLLEEQLPSALKDLAYRQGMKINNDPYFHVDIDRLILSLELFLNPFAALKKGDIKTLKWFARGTVIILSLLIVLLVIAAKIISS